IAGEGAETQTGFGYSVARRPEDLDVAVAAGDAAERATRLLGARQPASRRLTVVLEPRVTASLLGVVAGAIGGEAAAKGRSPGAGSRALSLVPGDRSPEELLAAVGDGVVVQSVTGLHSGANPVSGDFSVGVEGLMVRDGALAEPVREATIASTLQRMLKDVVAIGSDLEWLPGGAAGVTVVIGDVTLSGS